MQFALLVLVLTTLLGRAQAQFDDRLWLVEASGAGQGTVYEVDPGGTLVGSYPGPRFGSGGVAKDLFLGRVWVVDSNYSNGASQLPGAIRIYEAGIGQVSLISMPGVRGISVMSNGDLAVLLNEGVFQPSQVMTFPWNWNGQNPPLPVDVGNDAQRIRTGPNLDVWTLNRGSGTVSVLRPSPVTIASPLVANTMSDLILTPAGDAYISYLGTNQVVKIDRVTLATTIELMPESPAQMGIDGDGHAHILGSSGAYYRVQLSTATILNVFFPAGLTFGRLIPDQRGTFWLEDRTNSTVRKYDTSGTALLTLALPTQTTTLGDPRGLDFAFKTFPGADLDGDAVTNAEELRRGTDVLDGTSVPPTISAAGNGPPGTNDVLVTLSSPSAFGLDYAMLIGVTGLAPVSAAQDLVSAPFFEVGTFSDPVTMGILANDQFFASIFSGLPMGMLDSAGEATVRVDLRAFPSLGPDAIRFYASAWVGVLPTSGQGAGTFTNVTSGAICFDNRGAQCVLP